MTFLQDVFSNMVMQLPAPMTLSEAVREVTRQNVSLGYTPSRFRQLVEEGYAPNLLKVCMELFYSGDALQALEIALDGHPALLTLEDLVAHSTYGKQWGFDEDIIRQAEARVQYFDERVGHQRWSS